MKMLMDLSSVQAILQHGVNRGLWTVEDLDTPPPEYHRQLADARQSRFYGPDFTPNPPYANPLRSPNNAEVVQPIDPRDFDVAAATRPNEGQPDMDLQPLQWPPVPGERYGPDLSRHQDATADGGDHGQQAHLGTKGEPPASNAGSLCQSALEPEPAAAFSTAPW